MAEVNRLVDALGLFLSGGASNLDPNASLGGVASSTRVRGHGAKVGDTIPSIRIDNVFPACGEGDASLLIDAAGDLVFTPPGVVAGTPVTIADGESKILSGVDSNKAIRVFREAGLASVGLMDLKFVDAMNGVLAHGDVTDAQRAAGVTTYRALMLTAQGPFGVIDIRLWLPPVSGAQATYSMGTEVAVGSTIQIIADEFTAPAAVVFSSPTTEGAALVIPAISPGDFVGLWIRKTFPIGTVAAQEDVQLAMKYLGA